MSQSQVFYIIASQNTIDNTTAIFALESTLVCKASNMYYSVQSRTFPTDIIKRDQ